MAPITEYVEKHFLFGAAPQSPPPSGEFWLFLDDNEPVACDFLCPCGCGTSCYTPLKMEHPRCWNYSPGPTLTPSIRFTSGCKAHFHITGGKAILCGDSGK